MIKALLVLLDPVATWERIARAKRSLLFILFLYLVPFLLFTAVVEGYGLVTYGKMRVFQPHRLTVNEAIIFEAFQFGLYILIVFVGANLIKSIGETFHGRHTLNQSFTAVAYGLGPMFLLHLLDVFRDVSPWVSWPIGIILSIGVLYQGVPRMMEPDPSHAFGLFLMSALLLSLITGLARFVTAWYLQGKFTKLEDVVSELARRLPF